VQVCIPFKDALEHWQLSIVGTPLTEAHLGWSCTDWTLWSTQHLQALVPRRVLLQSHEWFSRLLTVIWVWGWVQLQRFLNEIYPPTVTEELKHWQSCFCEFTRQDTGGISCVRTSSSSRQHLQSWVHEVALIIRYLQPHWLELMEVCVLRPVEGLVHWHWRLWVLFPVTFKDEQSQG
jgi:hypothetical protein